MKYTAYKMEFLNGVHLGKNSIEDSDITFCADTLFSALCQEAVHAGEDKLQDLYKRVKEGRIVFSDAMPYIGNTYYIPKPMLKVEKEVNGDSKIKKAFKKLSYIPLDKLDQYMNGTMNVEQEAEILDNLGVVVSRVFASVRGVEETKPYRVGICQFYPDNGLFIILGYEEEQDRALVEELLTSLSYSGIGGKRYAGLGRFELYPGKLEEDFCKRLSAESEYYMTLSVSLPLEEEMDKALADAAYLLIKRSGFVASYEYAEEQLRKRDLFVLKAGSCVKNRYCGSIYDVSDEGKHPVYRYAKPLFLGVGI